MQVISIFNRWVNLKVLKVRYLLSFAPLFVFGLLIPINIIIHQAIVPHTLLTENQGVAISLSMIAAGLFCGIIGVFTHNKMVWYIKLLMIFLYIPAIMFSLLISGL